MRFNMFSFAATETPTSITFRIVTTATPKTATVKNNMMYNQTGSCLFLLAPNQSERYRGYISNNTCYKIEFKFMRYQ